MQWLCLGGSFDPIHFGHTTCARSALEQTGCDAVRLIPTAINPHKAGAKVTAGGHRLSMCQLAAAGLADVVVDDLELRRPAPSYTFDTVLQLRQSLPPGDTLAWLVGTDLLARMPTWHRFEELIGLIRVIVMQRAGHPRSDQGLPDLLQTIVERTISVPHYAVSSTLVRERVRMGLSVSGLVHPAVERYIAEHQLYRDE